MATGVIYLLTFADGQKYVGQTVNLSARLTRHRTAARAGVRVHVSRAWGELGEPTVTVLCEAPVDQLNALEQQYIRTENSLFPAGLNRESGGSQGAEVCAATRELHREANLRRYSDPAERERTRQQVLKRFEDPAEREAASRQQLERYKDPAARLKTGKAMRQVAERPEQKLRRSRASASLWQDPAYRAQQQARMSSMPSGENCSWTKLTAEAVLAIRSARDANVPIAKLAQQYGVSPSMVCQIGKRKTWKHLPERQS